MNDRAGKLLIVESDDALRTTLITVLGEAGYEVSTDYRRGLKSVMAFEPDLVILGADPPQLDCCDLLFEIKASKHTQNIRVVMLVHGSVTELTRGLDLGADPRWREDGMAAFSASMRGHASGNSGRLPTSNQARVSAYRWNRAQLVRHCCSFPNGFS